MKRWTTSDPIVVDLAMPGRISMTCPKGHTTEVALTENLGDGLILADDAEIKVGDHFAFDCLWCDR